MPDKSKKLESRRLFLQSAIAGVGAIIVGSSCSQTEAPSTDQPARVRIPDRLKAFCVDFNWQPFDWTAEEQGDWPNRFAKPGVWADASPKEHVAWYKALGVNVMQTFAVSCNGYAWYKGGKIPPQPGLKHDFLTESVKLGHEQGLLVMGYYCIGSNTRWGMDNPDLNYGTPSTQHIPFTNQYLDFLAASIKEAIELTDLDGFMIDWVWNPNKNLRKDGWIDAEKKLYEQLMNKPFPASGAPSEDELVAYERTAIDRCWSRIHEATKTAKPECIIWLSIGDPSRPEIAGSNMLKEVDWAMNENANTELLNAAKANKGADIRLLQCLVGWKKHDAREFLSDPANQKMDFYGFAQPRRNSLPLPVEDSLANPVDSFSGKDRYAINDKNTATLARFYNGLAFDAVVPKKE